MEDSNSMEQQMQHLSLNGADDDATQELARFRSLSQKVQQQLLFVYPKLLATAMHEYSSGADCELVLKRLLEGSSEMLRVRNKAGEAPIAVALLNHQDNRADWLMKLAEQRNPEALGHRSKYLETLSMISTSNSQAGEFIERLLARDPTQVHRPYDCDGRNLLHHCALEESINALKAVLSKAKQLLTKGSLTVTNLSAAVHMNDERGDTPMHLMAMRNRSDMLAELVNFCETAGICINLDERRHFGTQWTPLMVAAAARATEAFRFLLDQDADPDLEDRDGNSVQQLADGKPGLAELLKPFFNCMAYGDTGAVTSNGGIASTDSGIQSCPSADMNGEFYRRRCQPHEDGLTAIEIADLDEHLRGSGQAEGFIEAMRWLNPSLGSATFLPQIDKPVVAAFAVWAHLGVIKREKVAEALKSIGSDYQI